MGASCRAIFATKASEAPLKELSWAFLVIGKSDDNVVPVTRMFPEESTAIPDAPSCELPPSKLEKSSPEPVALSTVTNASVQGGPNTRGHASPPNDGWIGSLAGKSEDCALPVTNAFPRLSTAILLPASCRLPP